MANPILKSWEWFFKKEWEDTISETMIAITAFICFASPDYIDLPGPVRFRGKVFNRPGFNDGDEIITSTVVRLEKVPMEASFQGLVNQNVYGDRFCAITESGSRYEFVESGPEGMSPNQFLAMGTIIHKDII